MELLDKIGFDIKNFIVIVMIIVGAVIFARAIRWLINRTFLSETGKLNLDPTTIKFFRNAASIIIWVIAIAAIIYTIPRLRALAITLFAGAGIFMAIMGLAAQQAFSNIISGVFIVLFKPFRVDDLVQISSHGTGFVEDITLRHTVIRDFQNRRIIIPNSVMSSETVINSDIHDSKICEWVEIGISYDSDIDIAFNIMEEEALKHPNCMDNRTAADKKQGVKKVRLKVIGFGDSSINLRLFAWASNPIKAREMRFDLNKSIKERFDKEGVEIPFPYRTLVYKKDLSANAKLTDNE